MMDTPNTLNSGMCRCCSSEGTFKDIKTKYHWMGEEEVYADMLTDCFDIKIEIPEGMDNGICEVCITQLRNAANFKKQVLHTEEQFKRRLQNKDIKNPIKLESLDDSVGSDHLSDPDYSGNEYEVPIKEEIEEKPKAKKRSVQATTSRAKKPKTEPESSSQQTKVETLGTSNNRAKETACPFNNATNETASDQTKKGTINRKRRKGSETSPKAMYAAEMAKHQQNLETLMLCSNATPTRGYSGIGYICYFCSVRFLDPANLKTHTMDYHHDLRLPPNTRPPQLDSYSIKLDITALTCKICLKLFEDLNHLMDHLRLDHAQPIFTDVKSYMLPFRFGSGPLKCVFCDMEFNAFKMAVEHMNIHFRNFICDVCDAGFVNRCAWRNHKLTHERGDHPCKHCPKVFNSASKLRNHTQGVHFKAGRNKCPHCSKKFNCLIAKNNHMAKDHGVTLPLAKCNACDKTFKNFRSLSLHKKTYHLLEKRFKCSECEVQFTSSSSLRKHMLKHTGVRDFKCDICHKAFFRKSTLTQHMRVHSQTITGNQCSHTNENIVT